MSGDDEARSPSSGVPRFRLDALIETERLLLRPFTVEDAPAVHAIRSRPEVALYLYGDPWEVAEAEHAVEEKAPSRRSTTTTTRWASRPSGATTAGSSAR